MLRFFAFAVPKTALITGLCYQSLVNPEGYVT